jgi:hypothetical protein
MSSSTNCSMMVGRTSGEVLVQGWELHGLGRSIKSVTERPAAWITEAFATVFDIRLLLLLTLSGLAVGFLLRRSCSIGLISAWDGDRRGRTLTLRWRPPTCLLLAILVVGPEHEFVYGASTQFKFQNETSSSLCDPQIRAHTRTYENNMIASRLPYGRTFIEQQFDQALYYYPDPHGVTNERRNSFLVRSCYLFRNQSDNSHDAVHHRTKHLCASVSLAGLLIGSEVVPPISITSQILHMADGPPICEWKVKFTDLIQPASYKLQIWTYGINELSDPTAEQMTAQKTDRHNSGTSVSLTGIGVVNTVDLLPFYDFTGHTVRHTYGTAIYFVVNKTTIRGFANYDAYLQGGFADKNLVVAPEEYFHVWNEEFPPFDVDTVKATLPKPSDLSEFVRLVQSPQTSFLYGGAAHLESMVFHLPDQVEIVASAPIEPVARSVKLCRDPESVSHGRWVLDPTCEEHFPHNSRQQIQFYDKFMAGDICQHTETTVLGDVPNRLRGLVWKPWDCDIIQFTTKPTSVEEPLAVRLNSSMFCAVIDSMDGSSDREVLTFSSAARKYLQATYGSKVQHRRLLAASDADSMRYDLYVPLSFCLRASGVAFVAGFGDSLGLEQLDNFKNLLGNLHYWSNERNEISCTGSSSSHLHNIEKGVELVGCIQSAVQIMMSRSSHLSLFNFNMTAEALSASRARSSPLTDVTVPAKTVVLITNFMAQHIGIRYSLARIEELLHEQASLHTALAASLRTDYNLTYRRIFFTGIASHGFKANGLTNARQQRFADKAKEILSSADGGFEIVDMFNVSLGRPDATADGIHYKGGVSRALTDLLAHVLCVSSC